MSEAREMYLKHIYCLSKIQSLKAVDLAKHMNISKASVSKTLKTFKQQNLINLKENGSIILTSEGLKIATALYDRFVTIQKFLKESLDLTEEESSKNACHMEHCITDDCYYKMKHYIKEETKC